MPWTGISKEPKRPSRKSDRVSGIIPNKNRLELILTEIPEGHLFLEVDVGNSESVNKAVQAAIDQYKRPPTVIVNSAGITRDGFLLKMSEADFDSVINVNLKVSALLLHHRNILSQYYS